MAQIKLSDLVFDKSFDKKSEAQSYAEKQKKKYKYVRVVKSVGWEMTIPIVTSSVHRKTSTYYRVYLG